MVGQSNPTGTKRRRAEALTEAAVVFAIEKSKPRLITGLETGVFAVAAPIRI
jgi:hypothetical protein